MRMHVQQLDKSLGMRGRRHVCTGLDFMIAAMHRYGELWVVQAQVCAGMDGASTGMNRYGWYVYR